MSIRMRSHRFVALTVFVSVVIASCSVSAQTENNNAATRPAAKLQTNRIEFDGRRRTFLLASPSQQFDDETVGLIFVLHGGGGSAKQIARNLRVHRHDLAQKYVVVYPDALRLGRKRNWNDGRTSTQAGREALADYDDVGFLSAIVERAGKQFPIDPRRIYAMGVSNGAFMSNRLAAETDLLAAIGPVIGSMAEPIAESFSPASTVSVLAINGVDDPLVPYKGGMVKFGRQELGMALPIRDAVAMWAGHNGCTDSYEEQDIPERDRRDRTKLSHLRYAGCPDGISVELYSVHGGGHTWPGARSYAPKFMVGRTSKEMDATTVILEFFEQHAKPH